ncbi:hypothetical protein L6Q96_14700 [Candidatus Binatia bacterium]|nr:hypothetical protein [Candidatus Binatia bacterium]
MRSTAYRAFLFGLALLGWPPGVREAAAATPCASSGQPFPVMVTYEQPGIRRAESLTLRIVYPSDRVTLGPSASPEVLSRRIEHKPANTIAAASATDGTLTVVLSRAQGFEAGDLFTVRFDRCTESAPPTAEAFRCTVETAGTASGSITGGKCAVR